METADLRLSHTELSSNARQSVSRLNGIRTTRRCRLGELLIHQSLNGVITTAKLLLASIAVTEFATNHGIGEIVIGTSGKRIGRL